MKKLLFIFPILGISLGLSAQKQGQQRVDSLEQVVFKASEDTLKINALNSLSWEMLITGNYDKGIHYANQALALLEPLLKSSGQKNPTALLKAKAQSYNNLGAINYVRGDYVKADEYYFRSLEIRENIGDKKGMANSYNNIANIHTRKHNYPEAIRFNLKALELRESIGDKKDLAVSYNNLGGDYAENHEEDKALEYFWKALRTREAIGDKKGMADSYTSIALINTDRSRFAQSIDFLFKALNIYQAAGDLERVTICYNSIAIVYLKQARLSDNKNVLVKNVSEAKKYAGLSLALAKKMRLKEEIKDAYLSFAQSDSITGNFKSAYEYQQLSSSMKDSILNEANSKQIVEMQTKYETEKKEKENDLLTKENQIKTMKLHDQEQQRNALIITFSLILIVGGFAYNYYRLKNRNKLLQERESRTNAIFHAQEEEKIRLSKELHDGVGPLLSLIKLNISSIPLDASNEKLLIKTKELATESIKEVRNISHSLMPSLLSKSGLQAALNELIEQTSGEKLKLHLDYRISFKLRPEAELNLYRIVQESVNNILKHAEATKAQILFEEQARQLLLTISDNGIGFDSLSESTFSGNGLNNIFSRVDLMKGKVDLESKHGTGTRFTIQIPLNQLKHD